MEITAESFTVTVLFNPSNINTSTSPFTFDKGDEPHSSFSATVDQAVGLVRLHLQTVGSETLAEFATDPIEWLSGAQPTTTPAGFFVSRRSGTEVLITDFNSVTEETHFPFKVKVTFDGQPFTSDEPTIINQTIPPGSVG